jgi:phage terminase Nu1 subunit (DNA packaging protein)
LAHERAALAHHQAAIAELKAARLAGAVIEIEIAGQIVEQHYGVVRDRLLSIPGSTAAQLVGLNDRAQVEKILNEKIAETLTELNAPAVIEAARGDTSR